MTSLPCVRTQRHLHTQKLLTSFWRENFSRWVADVILAGKFFQMGILSPYARVRTHDVTPLRTYATPSAYAKTADVFWREIQPTYARVCTHDVIFPRYTSLPTPDGGYSTTIGSRGRQKGIGRTRLIDSQFYPCREWRVLVLTGFPSLNLEAVDKIFLSRRSSFSGRWFWLVT